MKLHTLILITILIAGTVSTYVFAQEVPPEEVSTENIAPIEETVPEESVTEVLPEDSLPETVTEAVSDTTDILEDVPLEITEDIATTTSETLMCVLPEDTLCEAPESLVEEATSTPEELPTDVLPPVEIEEEVRTPDPFMRPYLDGEQDILACTRGNWEYLGYKSMGECVREVRSEE